MTSRAFHPASFIDVLEHWSTTSPDRTACRFLSFRAGAEPEQTYRQLAASARAIGAALQGQIRRGDRVLLLYPPGLDFVAAFLGCCYAGAVAVPVYPPDPARARRDVAKLSAIIADARPAMLLSTTAIQQLVAAAGPITADLTARAWLATDALDPALAAQWRDPGLTSSDIAFLQYTSGSTGQPKGVMVSHGNLLSNVRGIQMVVGGDPSSTLMSWLPLYHDMGLIGCLLHGLYIGTSCILMSPLDFLEQPVRWLEAISRHRAALSGGPNFAYELCVRKISPEQRQTLDLSSWRIAFNGAEPIRRATLERFTAAFKPHGFRGDNWFPCYGLAESTLIVTGSTGSAPRFEQIDGAALERDTVASATPEPAAGHARTGRWFVGCGHPLADHQIAIVDPVSLARCAPDQVGEIWVAGPSVGQGYWAKPDHTAQIFGARLSDGEGVFLRTGDLGFVRDGELFVTGRRKDVIIVRGRNHYPQDIELTAETAHPALRPGCSAAFTLDDRGSPPGGSAAEGRRGLIDGTLDDDGTERLALVCELDRRHRDTSIEDIAAAVGRQIAEHHELELHELILLEPGRIPKTSSGKIQRSACRMDHAGGKLTALSTWRRPASAAHLNPAATAPARPDDPSDQAARGAWLRAMAAHVLDVPPDELRAGVPLLQLGLSSLSAAQLRGEISRVTGVSLPLHEVLEAADLDGLAALVALRRATVERDAPAITAHPADDGVPSFAQQRLWFLDQLASDSADYNECIVIRMTGPLRHDVLSRALHAVIDRHDVLRTAFSAGGDGEPVRASAPGDTASLMRGALELVDVQALPADERAGEAMRRIRELAARPFDLGRPPLLRAAVVAIDAAHHLFAIAVHHILCDARSAQILCDELAALYDGGVRGQPAELPVLAVQYADVARWERERLSGATLDGLVRYWRQQLANLTTQVALPFDRASAPGPAAGGRGARVRFALSQATSDGLRALARREAVTASAPVLAALFALLHRHAGHTDLAVGMPVSCRPRPETAPLIGMFVNTVVMRGDLSGDPTFRQLIARTGACVVAGIEHQDLPFDLLVKELRPERRANQSPLFNVMFSFGGAAIPAFVTGGLSCEIVALDRPTARFDLTMTVADAADGFTGTLDYDPARFDADTIERMARQFEILVRAAVADPERAVSALPLIHAAAPSDRHRSTRPARARADSERLRTMELPDRIATLSPEKRELLSRSLQHRAAAVIRARPRTSDRAPCSFAQQRLWFLHQIEPESCAYNMPGVLRVRGRLAIPVLQRALDEVSRRHESLRTTFVEVDGQPMQIIGAPGLPLREIDLQHLPAAERAHEAMQRAHVEAHTSFDLAAGPLIRATLIVLGPDEMIWLWTMHHIISDGWANTILIKEVIALYQAYLAGVPSPLPELSLQYADFAIWQREHLQGAVLDGHLAYWTSQLATDLPTLNMPTDFPRPAVFSDRGAWRIDTFARADVDALKQLCQHERVTLFIALMVAVQCVLHAATGQDDIVIGTDVANRNRIETENLIGFCVNQLVLRTQLTGNPSFRELIARSWKVALGAYAHQDLPFDLLVKELNPPRAANRTPLFQAKLVLQNAPMHQLQLPGVTIEEVVTDNHTSKFDLLFSAQEDEHGLRLSTGYSADLFKPATIERLVRQLAFTTKTMATEPDMRLDHYVRRLIQLETEYQQSRQAEFKHASRQRLQLNRKKDHRGASTP